MKVRRPVAGSARAAQFSWAASAAAMIVHALRRAENLAAVPLPETITHDAG
jgi:hypothetical protein